MRFLGWLRGKGMLMGGLIAMCLLPLSGCPESTPKDDAGIYEPDEMYLYGIMDAEPPNDMIYQDVVEDSEPPPADLMYGIMDVSTDNFEPEVYPAYGIMDAFGPDTNEPDVFPVYGIMDAVETNSDANAEVYGIWPGEVKEDATSTDAMFMYGVWPEDVKEDSEDAGPVDMYGVWPEDTKQ
jgi:hypothetical protein